MQVANANPHITITVRHENVTDALRSHATKKIEGLHLDYPRIIEAKVILDVQKDRHIAEVILFCADHITIDASTEGRDMYASIDETVSKIARRMRKHKTRLLKKHRPRPEDTIKHIEQRIFDETIFDHPEDSQEDPVPYFVHPETYRQRTLRKEEAVMELELSDRPFVLFTNERRNVRQIVYRRKDGEYGVIDVD